MPFPTAVASDASVDGVASIDTSGWHANALQVSVHNVTTGTGTVTIQVKPAGVDEWQAVIGATVDLTDATAPRTFTLETSCAANSFNRSTTCFL